MWTAWNIHHYRGRDQYWPMIKRSSGRRQRYVSTDSVLCVGQVQNISGATERWKGRVEDLKKYSSYQDTVGLDGEPIEFEWKIVPGFSSLSLLREIQNDLETKNIKPEDFKDRIIFMSMFNDIVRKKNDEHCISNAEEVWNYAMKFLPGHWTFLGPGSEEKWCGDSHVQKGQWNCTANKIGQRFKETRHPFFKSTSALSRGILKERRGRCTIHFNGDFMNTELLFPTVHSVNQLSVHGAVASWCMPITGGSGLARVPNLRVCKLPCSRSGTRRERRAN